MKFKATVAGIKQDNEKEGLSFLVLKDSENESLFYVETYYSKDLNINVGDIVEVGVSFYMEYDELNKRLENRADFLLLNHF
ncbi:MAG: hypothetical protein IKI05_03335 [Bacteroidaceae bacterium]|nr:hypothetical protein [Bacteroidaceae bacterium]